MDKRHAPSRGVNAAMRDFPMQTSGLPHIAAEGGVEGSRTAEGGGGSTPSLGAEKRVFPAPLRLILTQMTVLRGGMS